jgi:hypothetical protein
MAYALLACRCLVALVFLVSVVGKVGGPRRYTAFVRATGRLLPTRAATRVRPGAAAAAVILAEAAVVVLLAASPTAPWGFALAGLLALAFAAAVAAAIRRGERAPCNCFGVSQHPLGRGQLVRNLLLIAAAGAGLALGTSSTVSVHPGGAVAALAGAAAIAAVLVTADDIVALFRPIA